MTEDQKDVLRVAQDLLDNGAVEVGILPHVFGYFIRVYPENKYVVGGGWDGS